MNFIEIPPDFLRTIAAGNERIPSLYYSRNRLLRTFFLMRLKFLFRLLVKYSPGKTTALDFGGGSGILLPSLAGLYAHVTAVDMLTEEAEKVVSRFSLKNVRLVKSDIREIRLPQKFDVIVAADVLEHFKDLDVAAVRLREWLNPDGFLFTSLPSENAVYRVLRLVFGVQKPADHYHTGEEVEKFLWSRGFQRVDGLFFPLRRKIFPLFLLSVWRLPPEFRGSAVGGGK